MNHNRLALAILASLAAPALPATLPLDRQFTETVQPVIARYCTGCHSGNSAAAQFDLKSYTTLASVVRDYPRWELVLSRLSANEMPPKQMPQPPAEARRQVIEWIQAVRAEEIRKHAGDPGPVLTRRLSNAEYNYTIRDLTGVDLRPAREFPVDPANQAGFDNSGESLTISPGADEQISRSRAPDARTTWSSSPMASILRPIPCWSRPTASATPSSGSWTSTTASPPISPITSRPPGATNTAPALGEPKATLAAIAARREDQPAVSGDGLADSRSRDRTGRRRPDREAPGHVARTARPQARTSPIIAGGPSRLRRDARLRPSGSAATPEMLFNTPVVPG